MPHRVASLQKDCKAIKSEASMTAIKKYPTNEIMAEMNR
jgi:hypothetical protein